MAHRCSLPDNLDIIDVLAFETLHSWAVSTSENIWCPLMSAGHGVVSVCPACLPSSAPAHGQTPSPIPRFPPLLVLCWCSSLPCLQNSVFSDCGADNECWFIPWLIAILCDLCSRGWEVFAYWVKRIPCVAALSSPPSVPRMSSAWKRHLASLKRAH